MGGPRLSSVMSWVDLGQGKHLLFVCDSLIKEMFWDVGSRLINIKGIHKERGLPSLGNLPRINVQNARLTRIQKIRIYSQ